MSKKFEDASISTAFKKDKARQQAALEDLRKCRTPADFMAFGGRWLGVGSVQIPFEIEGVVTALRAEKTPVVCEIGTYHGGTNLLLSQALSGVETMIGVDLFIVHKPHLKLFMRPEQTLHFVEGSSYSAGTVQKVEKVLNGKLIDVLFIDGDHNYEGVKKDFLMYRHLVRENGKILFHDIVQDHKIRYGRETDHWAGGVPILWQELKRFYPHQEFVEDPEQDGLGIGMLTYSPAVKLPDTFTALNK